MHFEIHVTYRRIAELRANPSNARRHSADKIAWLAEFIRWFGFIVPIMIDEHGVILDGHARLEAAKSLGQIMVPTICLDQLTAVEKVFFPFLCHRMAAMAEWDFDLLMNPPQTIDG